MGKYDDLIFTIPQEHHSWYGFVAPRGFFRGTTMMEKAKVYMDWTAVNKPLPMEGPRPTTAPMNTSSSPMRT